MKYKTIDSELFVQNRKKFNKLLNPESIAIFHSNDLMPKNGDQTFYFRQNSDLFYLSGIDQEEIILVLFPDSPIAEFKEALFIKETNEHTAVWEGKKLSKNQAKSISGIKNVHRLNEFDKVLPVLMNHTKNCYLNLNENDRFLSQIQNNEIRFAKKLKEKYPLHNYERSAPLMTVLRAIKSNIEIDLIKKACDITEKAFRRILKFVKPGVMEYEVEAEISHEFLINRANGHAYDPIVASGENGCVLHYVQNDKKCKDGDILMLDFGADYANYASDLSRAIPVNGKFTKRQKDVYNAVLRVMRKATQMLTPGTIIDEYHKKVGKLMEKELILLGLLDAKAIKKQDSQKPLYKEYFMHGTSHFLGLDVHDIGNKYEPIKEGMVFTCEPGIYIPKEKFGIRLENDILVTKKGPVDLMGNIPIEADEIETLMNES